MLDKQALRGDNRGMIKKKYLRKSKNTVPRSKREREARAKEYEKQVFTSFLVLKAFSKAVN
jgi:hypothetical protein